jgi:hypothetical protein
VVLLYGHPKPYPYFLIQDPSDDESDEEPPYVIIPNNALNPMTATVLIQDPPLTDLTMRSPTMMRWMSRAKIKIKRENSR